MQSLAAATSPHLEPVLGVGRGALVVGEEAAHDPAEKVVRREPEEAEEQPGHEVAGERAEVVAQALQRAAVDDVRPQVDDDGEYKEPCPEDAS